MDQVCFNIHSIDRCHSHLVMELSGHLRGSGSGMEGESGREREICVRGLGEE